MDHLACSKTPRGFPFATLTNLGGQTTRLQWSSLADCEALWIGEHHLSREQVLQILPVLVAFAMQGYDFDPAKHHDFSAFWPIYAGADGVRIVPEHSASDD